MSINKAFDKTLACVLIMWIQQQQRKEYVQFIEHIALCVCVCVCVHARASVVSI